MKKFSKLIRVATVFALLVNLMPVVKVYADNTGSTYEVTTASQLQTKINEAQSGDTVILMNDITLTSPIKIYNGRFFTIVSSEGHQFSLIRGAGFTGDMIKNNTSHVTFSRVTLDGNNIAVTGAVIDHICAGSTTLADGSVIKNHHSELMAAVTLLECGRLEIQAGSGITNCSSPFGGAVYAAPGNVRVKAYGYIKNCLTSGYGGAVYASGNANNTCFVKIDENAIIMNNTAGYGGGIAGTDGANISISAGMAGSDYGVTGVHDNTAEKQGGGVYLYESSLHLNGAVLVDNSAAANYNSTTGPSVRNGQDIYVDYGSSIDIQGSVWIGTELYLDSGVELNVTGALSLVNSNYPIPISTNVNKAQYIETPLIVSDYYTYLGNVDHYTLNDIKNLFTPYSIDTNPLNALFALEYNSGTNQILTSSDLPLTAATNETELKSLIAKAAPGEVTRIKIGSSFAVYNRIDISGGRKIVLIADSSVSVYKGFKGGSMFRIVGNVLSSAPLDEKSQLSVGANITMGYVYSSDTAPLVWADSARFTLLADSKIYGGASSPVQVTGYGEFLMQGGSIYGVRGNGVVNMELACSFTMNGGTIAGCTGTNGGAVYVPGGTTFTMNGGKIYMNKAVYGGGVYVGSGGTFHMTGGTFEENSVIYQDDSNSGGGVYIAVNGTMNMSGGTFIWNTPSVMGAPGQGGIPGGSMMVCGTLNLESANISIVPSENAWQNNLYCDIAVDGGIINVNASLSGMQKINITPVVNDINAGRDIIHYADASYNTQNNGTGEFSFLNSAVSVTCADPYTTVVATKVDLSSPVTWSALQAAVDAAPAGEHTKIVLHNPDPKWGINYSYRENPNGSSIQVDSTVNITGGKDIEISYKDYDPSLLGDNSTYNYDNANLMLRYSNDWGVITTFPGPLFQVDGTSKLTFSNITVSASLGLASGVTLTIGENSNVKNGVFAITSGITMNVRGGSGEYNVDIGGTANVFSGAPKINILSGGVANMTEESALSVSGTLFDVQSGGTLNITGGTIIQNNADSDTIIVEQGGAANISNCAIRGGGKPDDQDNSPVNNYDIHTPYTHTVIANHFHGGTGISNHGTLNLSGATISGFYTGVRLNSVDQKTITLTDCTITGNMYGLNDTNNAASANGPDDSIVPVKVILDGCTITGNYQLTKTQHYIDPYHQDTFTVNTFGGDIILGNGNVPTELDLSTGDPSTVGTVGAQQEVSTYYDNGEHAAPTYVCDTINRALPKLTLGGGSKVTGDIGTSATTITVASALTGDTGRFSLARNPGTHTVATAEYGGTGSDIAPYFTSPEFFVASPSSSDGTLTYTWPETDPVLSLSLTPSSLAKGDPADVTVTINSAATGTVSVYYDDGNGLQTITLNGGGTYGLSYDVPSTGSHTIYARYNGDAAYYVSTATQAVTVTGECETSEEVQNSIDSAPENAATTIQLSGTIELDALVIDGSRSITLQGAPNTVITNAHSQTGAWITVNSGSALTLDNIVMDGNASDAASDNAFVVNTGGTLTLVNGAVIRNSRTLNNGGAVDVEGGTLTITDGKIYGNTAALGGAVYLNGGTVNIQGGGIYSNRAASGGGLYVNSGTVNMTDGTIYYNTASSSGAGVFLKSAGAFKMSGDAAISPTNAVYLDTGAYITVNGALTSGSGAASIATASGAANTKLDVVKADYSGGTGNAILSSFLSADGSDLSVSSADGNFLQKSFGQKAYFNLSCSPATGITYADTVVVTVAYDSLAHEEVPTGSVTFYEGSTPLGDAVNLSEGSASVSIAKPAAGDHTVSFTYTGDAVYLPINAANSTTKSFTSGPATLTGTVTITGSAVYGQTLTAGVTGFPSDAGTLQYQWMRDGEAITGATGGTLTLTSADVGKPISVGVSSPSANYTGSVTSTATGNVAKADASIIWPTPSAVTYGQTLADTGIDNASNTGSTPGTFTIENSGLMPPASDEYTFTVVFTPSEPGNYNTSSNTRTVTVHKRDVTADDLQITPTEATYDGQTKSVTVSLISPYSGLGTVTVYYGGETTPPTQTGTYALTADFAEGLNYNAATGLSLGSLTIKSAPYSGGETVKPSNTVSTTVDGKDAQLGKSETAVYGGQTATIFTVDEANAGKLLTGENLHIIISMPEDKDVQIIQLSGQTVQSMKENKAVITLQTDSASYTIPADEINIKSLLADLGEGTDLSEVEVSIRIAKPTADQVKLVESAAETGMFNLVVPPVVFEVACSAGGKSIEVRSFNSYVERTIVLPDDVDISKISTAVVVEADGTVRPVPTRIEKINGKYCAIVSSMTNSVYSIISSIRSFSDTEGNWAEDVINELASKLVVSGAGNGMFEPDRDITRAEFAAIIVRALGLKPGTGANQFKDVKNTEWFCDYTSTAAAYNIISGYGNGKFGPNDPITREQVMTIVARAMSLTGLKAELTDEEVGKLLAGYCDESESAEYARSSIAACIKNGIVSGRDGNMIAPKDNITRGEVAAIVARLLEKSNLI